MRITNPSFEIVEQEDAYRHIEWAGRHCYKSLDKMVDGSAERFVLSLMKKGHGSPLEHATVYFVFPYAADTAEVYVKYLDRFKSSPYAHVGKHYPDWGGPVVYVTTNYRQVVEDFTKEELKELKAFQTDKGTYHEPRVTVKFTCDRGILAEFTRHRRFSFTAESTRYCRYSDDKFGNELTFIRPCWCGFPAGEYANEKDIDEATDDQTERLLLGNLLGVEKAYVTMVDGGGWKPEQARAILPNLLKTELIMTGFASDWERFLKLRCAGNAHPQARELAIPLGDELKYRGFIA